MAASPVVAEESFVAAGTGSAGVALTTGDGETGAAPWFRTGAAGVESVVELARGVADLLARGVARGGWRSPRPVASVITPRCSNACLLKCSGESHAAMLTGSTKMRKLNQRPLFDRESGWVHVASAQQSGGTGLDAISSAMAASTKPAIMTPGLNEGCKNAVSRPVKYVPRSTALQTARVIEGIQRVKREVIVGAGWSNSVEGRSRRKLFSKNVQWER